MIFLGIRSTSKKVRYALLKKEGNDIIFINKNSEHLLNFPANHINVETKILWLKQELDRIIRQNDDIEKIVIKINEYGQESITSRESSYMDAICLLSAAEHNIPVVKKINKQLGITSQTVKGLAETHVGKTDKYWDVDIAYALIAAFKELKK